MSESGEPTPPRPVKGAAAFRTIGEVADDLDLPAHVLRFWESKFAQLKPLKRRGGRRYYRPEDVLLLRRIRQCLYQDGYTIRGVQKLLGVGGTKGAAAGPVAPSLFPLDPEPDRVGPDEAASREMSARRPRHGLLTPETRAALEEIRRELREARAMLDDVTTRPKAG